MLEVDNVELSFNHKKILWGVYLKAKKNQITSIVGRNGCGKTSLLRIIFGSLKAKYATIRIDSLYQKQPLFKDGGISYLPQHNLLPENIQLKKVFGFYNVNWDGFVNEFDSFKKYKNQKVGWLSTGERRIAETYLILKKPGSIVLLDEPFSFIAPVYIQKIKAMIFLEKVEKTIILTDHYYEEIISISDNIYLLKNGCSKRVDGIEGLKEEGYLKRI